MLEERTSSKWRNVAVIGLGVGIIAVLAAFVWYKKIPKQIQEEIPVNQMEVVEKEEIQEDKVVENVQCTYMTGAEVITEYEKIKGTNYAFMVATQALLESDIWSLMETDEYNYLVYVLSNGGSLTAETIYTGSGKKANLVFMNYNRVINDTCLTRKSSSLFYETNSGYVQIENEAGVKAFYELEQRDDIFKIHEEAEFIAREIFNAEGIVMGCTYIEK